MQRTKGRKLLKKYLYDRQKESANHRTIDESITEIQVMKVDIEQNIESIVGQIDTATFEQCVDNYRENLEELNMVAKEVNAKLEKTSF